MAVWRIDKTIALGTVDSSMYHCPWPFSLGQYCIELSTALCGSSFDYFPNRHEITVYYDMTSVERYISQSTIVFINDVAYALCRVDECRSWLYEPRRFKINGTDGDE